MPLGFQLYLVAYSHIGVGLNSVLQLANYQYVNDGECM
jgi:hypothetical protein